MALLTPGRLIVGGILGLTIWLLTDTSSENHWQDVNDDFLTVPDFPGGQGLRTLAYAAYFNGSREERDMVADMLEKAGYPNAARHLR